MASQDGWDAPTEAGPTAAGGSAHPPPGGRHGGPTTTTGGPDSRRSSPRGASDVPEYAGPYRLLRRIGRGGMGAVFLAERADGQFERQVAVKLVKRGMDSEEILARFRRERQILASLRHRHIAALLDGGVTADGRPYLVMEHVEGTPITRYCDERRAPLAERLELFCHVCDAVGFAHRSLVVHRDLKPANVLVDGEGQVKLLDFGIAKLLTDEGDAGLTARREGHAAVMTPEYASPEQVRGGPVTTAVDVYQLGLLLYELVSGHRAQRLADASLQELERVVCDRDPPRPSVAVALRAAAWRPDESLEEVTPAAVAAARDTTAEALQRRLRGDVDAIVATALQKEPARRYPSVEALAADVRRHLRQQPVLARRPGLRYRALKLVRRHRGSAVGAGAAALALAAAAVFFTLRIHAERDRAHLEAAKASRSAALLESLFASWSPVAGDRERLRTDDLLRLAVVAAERDGDQGAEQRAATLSLLGGLHTELGAYAEADRLLAGAQAAQEEAARPVPLDLAATLERRSRLLLRRSRPEAAEEAARRAVALYAEELGTTATATLRARAQLATVLYWRERFADAELELRQVRAGLAASGQRSSSLHLEIERDLGYMLYHQGRIDESVPLLEAALDRSREAFGRLHGATLVATRQLGSAYRDQGRLAAAETLLAEAVATATTLYGPDHDETQWAQLVYAMLAVRQGRWAEAEGIARQLVAAGEAAPDDAKMAPRLCLLAGIRLDRGDAEEAERLLRRSLAAYRQAYPEGHQDERDLLYRLAFVVLERGGSDGPDLYWEALATHRERFRHLPVFVSDGPHFLASAAAAMGDLEVAEGVYRQAVGVYRGKLAPGHPHMVAALAGLAGILQARGEGGAAAAAWREACAQQRQRGAGGGDAAGASAPPGLAPCPPAGPQATASGAG